MRKSHIEDKKTVVSGKVYASGCMLSTLLSCPPMPLLVVVDVQHTVDISVGLRRCAAQIACSKNQAV